MSITSKKYPRTMHFPFSPGATSDDKIASEEEIEELLNCDIIFTSKLDGSNICLTSNAYYSRSHGGVPAHPSFHPLGKFHENIKHEIMDGISIFGEWCYAVHSIKYSMLKHHLNIFGVRDDNTGKWWDWPEVVYYAKCLKVPTVPVLVQGNFHDLKNLENYVTEFANLSEVYGPEREGLVVRKYRGVYDDGHKLHGLAKWVRRNHIQTNEHWTRKPIEKQPTLLTLEEF